MREDRIPRIIGGAAGDACPAAARKADDQRSPEMVKLVLVRHRYMDDLLQAEIRLHIRSLQSASGF
jgi:O-methyltransferase involved in polyketide biosynthesis